ncbi:MAG: AN1-type zinc finger domain-containing protein [Nitrososphaerales archaeon]
MANCEVCGEEVQLAYICNYCKGSHCGEHRLPESHGCWNMGAVKSRPNPFNIDSASRSPTDEFKRVWRTNRTGTSRGLGLFGAAELRDLVKAWLAISLAFSVFSLLSPQSRPDFPLIFGIAALTAGVGFLLHELAHKFAAQKYGLWAEFRAWNLGLIMAVMFAFTGFIFAAPGAVYIRPKTGDFTSTISNRENGIISVVGPLTNIVLAGFFFLLLNSGLGGGLGSAIGFMGVRINLFLAAFNMIPFGMFDGRKVFAWNKILWAFIAIPLFVTVIMFLTNSPFL